MQSILCSYPRSVANRSPDALALTVKRDGEWVKWTYKQYHDEVRKYDKWAQNISIFHVMFLTEVHNV